MLFDKSNDEIFYIGKGQDYRLHAHKGDKSFTGKVEKIKELEEAKTLGEKIIGRFKTEAEALSVEAVLIKWVYGFDNLTNLTRGYKNYNIRDFGDFNELPGIDLEKKAPLKDGSYTKGLTEKIIKNQVQEKLDNVNQIAHDILPKNYEIAKPDLTAPQDPTQFIYKEGWPARIRIKIGPAGQSISPAFFLVSPEQKNTFIEFVERLGAKVSNKKANAFIMTKSLEGVVGVKGSFNKRIRADDNESISCLITDMVEFLNQYST